MRSQLKQGDVMRVKVCGIRKIEDALNAVKFGADAVGLLVGQNILPRTYRRGDARSIVENFLLFVVVLVTHLTDNDKIISPS